jgi:hypothetical protein
VGPSDIFPFHDLLSDGFFSGIPSGCHKALAHVGHLTAAGAETVVFKWPPGL